MFQSHPKDYKTFAVGIDASLTSFGVCCRPINHEEWFGYTIKTDAKDGTDTSRAIAIAQEVIQDLGNLPYKPAVVCFEDYGPINKTAGKIIARGEMCGIIKYHVLHVLRVPVIMVPPNALKSYATGNGKAGKEDMLNTAHNQGYYANNHDEADAYFAAQLGATLYFNEKTGCSYTRVNPE